MDTKFFKQMFELSLDHRMNFKPDWSMENITTYIQAIDSYNNFYSKNVLAMIEKIDTIIPRAYYNEGNPNNGNRQWTIDIGRESSPVIYITVECKSLNTDRIHPDLLPIIISECETAAKAAKADEIWHEIKESDENSRYNYKEIVFRFWWD